MELRICCDAFVQISGDFSINDVKAAIYEHEFDNMNLTGHVLVNGDYKKNDITELVVFEEKVPFTLVFKNENYLINDIMVDSLQYYEVVNQGLECNFEIIVNYEIKKEVTEAVKPFKEIETPVIPANEAVYPFKEIQTPAIPANEAVYPFKEIQTPAIPVSEEIGFDDDEYDNRIDETEVSDEKTETAEEIKEKYDNLLKNVFSEAKRENNENINIKKKETNEAVNFSRFKEEKSKYSVYYTKKESEIERICTLEKVSVKSVYENDANKDYTNKRRIIIKK